MAQISHAEKKPSKHACPWDLKVLVYNLPLRYSPVPFVSVLSAEAGIFKKTRTSEVGKPIVHWLPLVAVLTRLG